MLTELRGMLCRVVRCVVLSVWLATHKRLYSANNDGSARLKPLHIYIKGPLTALARTLSLSGNLLPPASAYTCGSQSKQLVLTFQLKIGRNRQLYSNHMSVLLTRRVSTSFKWEREIFDFKIFYWGNAYSIICLRIIYQDYQPTENRFCWHLPAHSDFSIIAFLTSSRSSTIVQKELRGGPSDSSRPRQSVLSSPSYTLSERGLN